MQIGFSNKKSGYIWLHPLKIILKEMNLIQIMIGLKTRYHYSGNQELKKFQRKTDPLSLTKAKIKRTITQALSSKFSVLNPIIFVSLHANNILPIISKSNDIKLFNEVASSMFNVKSQIKYLYKSINFSRKVKYL